MLLLNSVKLSYTFQLKVTSLKSISHLWKETQKASKLVPSKVVAGVSWGTRVGERLLTVNYLEVFGLKLWGGRGPSTLSLLFSFTKRKTALTGVAQWIECQPENQRVASTISSQGTFLACGPGLVPSRGRARGNHALMFLFLFLPPFRSKINK